MRPAALLLAAAATALAADTAVQQLFVQVRDKVLDNASRVPRYTCVQTINRAEHRPQFGTKPATCEGLIAAREKLLSPGYLTWHDRLRLDVAVLDGTETFAWAGAHQFETTDIEKLTWAGSSASGDFASYLRSVFGMETTRIALLSEEKAPSSLSALFGFTVPVEHSRYVYHSHGTGEERVIGYHGTFLIDEARAELQRLTVEADHFPSDEQMCRVEDVMDYHRVKIGEGEFLLPETSKMTILFKNGQESENETRYSSCREYAAESSISFGDDPAPSVPDSGPKATAKLPANLRLEIGLKSAIHSETAAAGDAITAILLRDVKDGSGVVAHANDIVRGRILRLEQYMFPAPRWLVALRFDTIEDNGVERTLDLTPLNDGKRGRRDAIAAGPRPPGAGVFIFPERGTLALDQKFHSEWETR